VFAKEKAGVDAAPNAGDDCTPNAEVVACCCPKAVVDCPKRPVPNELDAGWLAPKAGVELGKLKGNDCAPNAGVLAPPKMFDVAPKAGVDVEAAPKLNAISSTG
jgi:hypothetical protein